MVERLHDLALLAARGIRESADLELVASPEFGTVVFRFRPDGTDATRVNKQIPDLLFARGRAVVGHTIVQGQPALKLTFCNPGIEDRHVRELLDTIVDCGKEISEDSCESRSKTLC